MDELFLNDFDRTLNVWEKKLHAVSEEESMVSPGPGKWCRKEILGHLIDSALNNHRRFVTAIFQGDLIFDGYDQERWVDVQNYNTRSWKSLVLLWKEMNIHLLHVINQIPERVMRHEHGTHNLDRIAWKQIPNGEPATLEYFIKDYLGHMKHHLNQIIPEAY